MGIGHVAFGLGLKSADRRLNAGVLIFGAFLADFLLGWFVLAGWESYEYPPDYASRHYMLFTFPWSHGLVPLVIWGAALGAVVWLFTRRVRAALLAGVAVLSHYLLDGIVHLRGLPVAGPHTPALGLGLWRHLPLELSLEAFMAVVGLWLYLNAARDHRRGRRIAMAIYTVLLAAMAIGGQATATEELRRTALIVNWISVPVIFAALAGWIDAQPHFRAKLRASSM